MHRQLSPDAPRSILAGFTLLFVLWVSTSAAQFLAIALAGIAGMLWLNKSRAAPSSKLHLPISKATAAAALFLFVFFFVLVETFSRFSSVKSIQVLRAFYQSGALVFGGGHVVLPLLQEALVRPEWMRESDFLTGYGAAQAIPGPLFAFAAYLGYLLPAHSHKLASALLCLIALFLPGILLVIGAVPYWQQVREQARARSAVAGINASVVGLLAAALVRMATATSLRDPASLCLVALDFFLLWVGRVSPLFAVLGSAVVLVLTHEFLA